MAANQQTSVTEETVRVPLSSIHVPDRGNVRRDLHGISELAGNLEQNGQLQPLVVSNGGPAERPFVLRAGNRRYAAMIQLGWKDALVVVRRYPRGDFLAPYVDTWTENHERRDVSPIDLGAFLHELVMGTYEVPEGEVAELVDRETICDRFRLTHDQVRQYLRVHRALDPEVAALARRRKSRQPPLRLLLSIAAIDGEGEDNEARAADRRSRQLAMMQAWISEQDILEVEGRRRRERSDKGLSRRRGMTLDGALANEDSEIEEQDEVVETREGEREKKVERKSSTPPLSPRRLLGKPDTKAYRSTVDYIRLLEQKQEKAAKDERLRLEGALAVFRFLLGQTKRLSVVSTRDFDMLELKEEA